MKKISLIATLFITVLLLEHCSKDTVTASASSTQLMLAVISDSTWYADTVSSSVAYTAATQSKVFTCTGIGDNKKVVFSVLSTGTPSTQGFTLGTFNVNTTPAVSMAYYNAELNSSGAYTFVQLGSVDAGSGSVVVTAVDSVKKLITGTYNFTSKKNVYDSNGNIIAVDVWQIVAGGFNNVPYTFTSN